MSMRTEKRRRLGPNHHSTPLLLSPGLRFLPPHARHPHKRRRNSRRPLLHRSRPQDYPLLPKTSLLCSNHPRTRSCHRRCRTKAPSQTNLTTSLLDMVSQAPKQKPLPRPRSRMIHSANKSHSRTTRRPLDTITLVSKAKHRRSLVLSHLPQTTTLRTSQPNNVRSTKTTMAVTVSRLHKPSKKPAPRNSAPAVRLALDPTTQLMLRVRSHRYVILLESKLYNVFCLY